MKFKTFFILLLLSFALILFYKHLSHHYFQNSDLQTSPTESMNVLRTTTSSFDDNYVQNLTIALNQSAVEDYEACANEIIRHCIYNDFPDTVFSYDVHGYPSGIYGTVYLKESDAADNDYLFQFSYTQTPEHNLKYNIYDHPEMFHLTITLQVPQILRLN